MALQLIDGMTGHWDPAKCKDEYRDDVMALVRRKIKSGQTHTILEPEEIKERRPARSEVMDLMPLLKKSLAERTGGTRRSTKRRERRAPGTRRPPSASMTLTTYRRKRDFKETPEPNDKGKPKDARE